MRGNTKYFASHPVEVSSHIVDYTIVRFKSSTNQKTPDFLFFLKTVSYLNVKRIIGFLINSFGRQIIRGQKKYGRCGTGGVPYGWGVRGGKQ